MPVIGWRAVLLLPALLAIAVWDARTRRIPNVCIAVLLAADWLLFVAVSPDLPLLAYVGTCSVLAGGAVLAVGVGFDAVAMRMGDAPAIGGGDVKLVAAFAAMPSCDSIFPVLLIACALALLYALFSGKGPKDTIPFGPFLVTGFAISVIVVPLVV
ncbi:MAG: prepilin peptidase [Eggerthellaceae bacterium]